MEKLLAVDLGLRTGLALYTDEVRLEWYRSHNFGSISRLKRAAYTIIRDIPGLTRLVIEGGGDLAQPWLREAARRGLQVSVIGAEAWRNHLMNPRDHRGSARAKASAEELAPSVIEWARGKRPTSLRHDTAEAILIGLWGVLEAGWVEHPPPFVS